MSKIQIEIPVPLITLHVDTERNDSTWYDEYICQARVGDHVIFERRYVNDYEADVHQAYDEDQAVENFQEEIAERLMHLLDHGHPEPQ